MKKKLTPYIIGGIVLLAVILGFILLSNNTISEKVSPISTVTLSDENGTIVITKNNLDKTAKIRVESYLDRTEMMDNEFGWDMTPFMIDTGTKIVCGLLSIALFDESAFEELMEEWSDMFEEPYEKDKKPTTLEEIEGYQVTQFDYYLKDKETKKVLSECVVTGPGEENIIMKIDGKVVSFEDNLYNDDFFNYGNDFDSDY